MLRGIKAGWIDRQAVKKAEMVAKEELVRYIAEELKK